jgi:hypothetical protein
MEPDDMEKLKKISDEIEAMGFTKPRVAIFGATSEKSEINFCFSKDAAQTQEQGS